MRSVAWPSGVIEARQTVPSPSTWIVGSPWPRRSSRRTSNGLHGQAGRHVLVSEPVVTSVGIPTALASPTTPAYAAGAGSSRTGSTWECSDVLHPEASEAPAAGRCMSDVCARLVGMADLLLADVVATSTAVAATRSRLAKRDALVDLLKRADAEDIEVAVAFLSGSLRQRRTGLGWASLRDLPPPAATSTLTT